MSLPPNELPEIGVEPDPAPDPAPDPFVARSIRECLDRLAKRPLQAIRARIHLGHAMSDRDLARAAGMTLNTFLQNIVRARRQLGPCLERKGVPLHETAS